MADELIPHSPPAPDPVATPPADTSAAPPEDDADLTAQIIEVPATALPQKGEKVVKFTALQEERHARKEQAKATKAAEERIRALEAQLGQVAPLVQAISQRPDVLEQLQKPPGPAQPQDDT